MTMKIQRILQTLFTFMIFFLVPGRVFAGLGISPSKFVNHNLSSGSRISQTFVLSRSDPISDLYFTVVKEGSTQAWVTLDKGTTFIMPVGQQRYPITVSIDVPTDVKSGRYSGGIRLISTSKSGITISNGASTALSALIQVDLIVTENQVVDYEISSIKIQNIEAGSPLDITLTLNNIGNMAASPTRVHATIYDKYYKELLQSQDVAGVGSVAPFMNGDIALTVPTSLGVGQYWADITAFKDENTFKEQSLVFEILKKGSLLNNKIIKEPVIDQQANTSQVIDDHKNGSVLAANTSIYQMLIMSVLLFSTIIIIVYFIISNQKK